LRRARSRRSFHRVSLFLSVSLSLSLSLSLDNSDPSPRSEGDCGQRYRILRNCREPPTRRSSFRETDVPRERRGVNVFPHPSSPAARYLLSSPPFCTLPRREWRGCRTRRPRARRSRIARGRRDNDALVGIRELAFPCDRDPSLRGDSGGVARGGWMRFPRRWSTVFARWRRGSLARQSVAHPRFTPRPDVTYAKYVDIRHREGEQEREGGRGRTTHTWRRTYTAQSAVCSPLFHIRPVT